MSINKLTDAVPFTLTLAGTAPVVSGTAQLDLTNFAQAAGTYDSDDITNASGVAGATVSDALDALDADATAALTAANIYAPIFDILSATGEVGGVDGYAGTITRISVVANALIDTGDLVVTFSIDGTPITGGVVTVPAATAALTRVAASPSAANVVAANQVISWVVSGGNLQAGTASIRIVIDPT